MTRLYREAIALAWWDGLQRGAVLASLGWIALGLTLLALCLDTRKR